MARPTVILDDATPGAERLLRFGAPEAIVQARRPDEVAPALARIEAALAAGRHVAGWFGYELGYALEPHLAPLRWPDDGSPLLWFGVFDAPQAVSRADLAAAGRAYAGPLRHEWDEAAYERRFARVHGYIGAGDIYQANLSFRSRFAFAGDPLALYLRLRDRAQAAHGAYLDDGERRILSLSPELFFRISPQGRIAARPMKGTAPRGTDELSDARAKAALAASPKDRAENLMIVDLVRNDIGRLALIGSVAVEDLFAVETYPTLHTMVSTVTARLKPATRVEQIVRALFPCGSITGAPKIRAMQIIRELEQSPRGLYCGAIGHFAPDGSASFNVAIRTITIEGGAGHARHRRRRGAGFEGRRRICRMPAQGALFRQRPRAHRIDRDAALGQRLRSPGPAPRAHGGVGGVPLAPVRPRRRDGGAIGRGRAGARADARAPDAGRAGRFRLRRGAARAGTVALDLRAVAASRRQHRRAVAPQDDLAGVLRRGTGTPRGRRSAVLQRARRTHRGQPEHHLPAARRRAGHAAALKRPAGRRLAPRTDRAGALRRGGADAGRSGECGRSAAGAIPCAA
ncbi:MAG: aminodeoxychorismate synthase component I [Rhizomicrobium sp.]